MTAMFDPYIYDLSEVQAILPHRSPFLFIDGVVSFSTGKSIVCMKQLQADDSFFAGHFPERPIMPGVLISEALAQACGLLVGLTLKRDAAVPRKSNLNLVLAGVNMKFMTPAKPGDTLRLAAQLQKQYGSFFLFTVEASIEDMKIAGGTLTLAETMQSP
ncbi:MAG TPA: beta-hydroxyacyl-ACP dehydratase [Deltaproteobacteria bacterium]|nr:beta-hydroxyacyl-ACP dehydratase [Deltaproteobacteria bacterium]HEU20572.1 beta-hydroxyacyl-ACP dehydratase [Deltaproteobacteria bacterium]